MGQSISGNYFFMFIAGAVLGLAMAPGMICGVDLGGTSRHVLAFATLALAGSAIWPRLHPLLLFAGLAVFGGAIELVQMWPALGRHAEWGDWFDDLKASATVIGAVWLLRAAPLDTMQSAGSFAFAFMGDPDRRLAAQLD